MQKSRISYESCIDLVPHCLLCTSAGTSAIAAGVSTALSSVAAISTIFGVGGAGK